MGISAGGDKNGPKSEINVTPLVDVVLVLLIIFMVAMPVMMRSISLEVPPKLDTDEVPDTSVKQVSVFGEADGMVKVRNGSEEQTVPRVDLMRTVKPILEAKRTEKVVFVDFDDKLAYGECISIMDTIRGAGAEKIAQTDRSAN